MNHPRTALHALLAAALLMGACHRQPTAADLDTAAACTRVPITYESDGLKIRALVSKPAGTGPFPIIIVNHGGFDPAEKIAPFADFFASSGYLALAPDYRGCGKSEGAHEVAKGEVNDVLAAIRHARQLRCADASRTCLFGFSHGAVLSLLAAARAERPVQGVIAAQGPVELADCYQHWVSHSSDPGLAALAQLHHFVGGTPAQQPQAWRQRSALYAAPGIRCPVLLIYSDADTAIPSDQGPRMQQALTAAGNTHVRLMMLPGLNHGLTPAAWMELRTPMVTFLKHPTSP